MNIFENHEYSVCATGIKAKSKVFGTRYAANQYMYKLIDKNNLHINEVWDDKHDKTYLCENNIKFYVQRVI